MLFRSFRSVGDTPLFFKHAAGAYVIDEDDKNVWLGEGVTLIGIAFRGSCLTIGANQETYHDFFFLVAGGV